jgi:hypothetical protein
VNHPEENIQHSEYGESLKTRFSGADEFQYMDLVTKPKYVIQLKEHITLSRISL